MSHVVVARPIDGITINGDLEFLLDDGGEVRIFDSPEEARSFLTANGVDPEELRHMTFMEAGYESTSIHPQPKRQET